MTIAAGAARSLAGASLSLCLCACSLLPSRTDPPADAPPGPAAAASSSAEATYRLEVDAPRELRTLLVTYLDLARFEGAAQAESITETELTRLANSSPAQARTLLETEGYFAADVKVVRETANDGLPLVKLEVDPGPRARVNELDLKPGGELLERVEAGDNDALQLLGQLRAQWTLPVGAPFRQAAWNAAKNGALAHLRSEGYPTASWKTTAAHVDAREHKVVLSGELESGPRFLIGPIVIEGMSRYDEALVRNVAELPPGTPYNEKRLTEFQERLLKLNFFETVAVEIDPDPATAAAAPVRVRVREQSLQQATTGFGYGDASRFSVTLERAGVQQDRIRREEAGVGG
jgi:translocation and assembly module TamA